MLPAMFASLPTWETRTLFITRLEHGVIRAAVKDDAELSLDDQQENERLLRQLLGGGTAPFLSVANATATYPPEVRRHFADPGRNDFKRAEAIVANTLSTRLLADFHVRVLKPAVPTQVFCRECEAEAWLQQFCAVPVSA